MASASPENFPPQDPRDLVYNAYKHLLVSILRALNIRINEQQTIFDEISIVVDNLEQQGYVNRDMVEHPLFDVDVNQFNDDNEVGKIRALDLAMDNIRAKNGDNRQTLDDKLKRGLELAHCFLQCAVRLNNDGDGHVDDYRNHNDWAYTIKYAIESVVNRQ